MSKPKKASIEGQGTTGDILSDKDGDYSSLTDIHAKDGEFSAINYRIHTDTIKVHLIPPEVTLVHVTPNYATEADLLNLALFDQTSKLSSDANCKLKGNWCGHATIRMFIFLADPPFNHFDWFRRCDDVLWQFGIHFVFTRSLSR
ncbi:MAG: hypothetical protein SFY80_15705 [Verrucomicrobiota bacterium]|nr:hypothetical protein [Verrucomicrobiota bacterium]